MKRLLVVLIGLIAITAHALPHEQAEPDRALRMMSMNNGYFKADVSNYGHSKDIKVNDGTNLVFNSSIWISGKKYRRDAAGRKLYWLTYPPTPDAMQTVHEAHQDWTPDLVAVQDTLTSIGFDGDLDLYELLPAYNPLMTSNQNLETLIATFFQHDSVLRSIMGDPAPLPFDPYNSETFCFSIPQSNTFDTPGFITGSAYYYDYCPFGTVGDRDLGQGRNRNTHWPLGLAVHQESYMWTLLDYHRMLVTKYTVHNTNDQDIVEDLAIGHYVDADVGPEPGGTAIAADDVSGYVKGTGYEFAYSRDYDGDDGLTPYLIASKVIVPERDYQKTSCWAWEIGDGPRDFNPQNIYQTNNRTTNEKYYLLTGRNPNDLKYLSLRPDLDDITEYEQPVANDTRFLQSIYGAQPDTPEYDLTDADGNHTHRFNLAPGESFSFYTILFVGESIDDLKSQSQAIESFVNSDFHIPPNSNQPCFPYLHGTGYYPPSTLMLTWYSVNDPDRFVVAYRNTPNRNNNNDDWTIITLPGSARECTLTDLSQDAWYDVKVGAYFYTPEEVYLESKTITLIPATSDTDDNVITPAFAIKAYPNPFKATTTIQYELKQAGDLEIDVYNIRGQKVRRLYEGNVAAGMYQLDWDAKDEHGKTCSDGIYFLRIKSDKLVQHKKISLIK